MGKLLALAGILIAATTGVLVGYRHDTITQPGYPPLHYHPDPLRGLTIFLVMVATEGAIFLVCRYATQRS